MARGSMRAEGHGGACNRKGRARTHRTTGRAGRREVRHRLCERNGACESDAALALAAAPAHISLLLAPFAERLTVSRRPLTDRLRGAFEDLARSGFTTARFCGLGGLIGEDDVGLVRAALDGPNLLRIRGPMACSCLWARLTLGGMQGSATIRSGWTRQRRGSAIGYRKTLSSSERPANATHGAGT